MLSYAADVQSASGRHALGRTRTAALREELRHLIWFLLAGVLLVGLGFATDYASTNIDRSGARTLGVVTGEKVYCRLGSSIFVSFEPEDGVEVDFEQSMSLLGASPEEGDQVVVAFSERDPSRARVPGYMPLCPSVLLLVGAACLAGSLLRLLVAPLLVLGRRPRR